MSELETSVALKTTRAEFTLIEEWADKENMDIEEFVNKTVKEKINNSSANDFEENGVVYERLLIALPRTVANYYRIQALAQDKIDHTNTLIEIDICNHVKSQIDGMTPEALTDLFNLKPALDEMSIRESKIFGPA